MVKIKKVKKRNGDIVSFNQDKITQAIFKALEAVNEGEIEKAKQLSNKTVEILDNRFKGHSIYCIKDIQDIVEEVLMQQGLFKAAKAYILYREQRRKIREFKRVEGQTLNEIEDYIQKADWEIKENANLAYSVQGLNKYIVTSTMKNYWLERIYPSEIRKAEKEGDFHIHKLQTLAPYCSGWNLYDLLLKGFGGISDKIQSKPAKHLGSALGQVVNFFYVLSAEMSEGAIAFSNFDTLLAPFIRYDNLSYSEVKQAVQEFLFNANIPAKLGFQTHFTNLSLDITPSPIFTKQPVIIAGNLQKETYSEFQREMDMLNKAFYETILEGDARGKTFTFPIPTINITKDFPWDRKQLRPMWEATAKYGINYFANFINSDMKPEDSFSMCCRLRLDRRKLYKRAGGLFGSGSLTGSIGVVTINMPRIGYLSKDKKEFLERLEQLMSLARNSLEIKRKTIETFTEKGLYPYCRYWLASIKKMRGKYWDNHFSTIGLIGMNEALLNFLKKDIGTEQGRSFALEVLDFMREKLIDYQKETGNLYNLEATPAESTSFRLALKDKERYPDIITAGAEGVPYYTNSSHLPVDYGDDIFRALELQDKLQCKYTGGCIEKGNKVLTDKGLLPIEYIVENFETLKPIRALSFDVKNDISEWDDIIEAVKVNVAKHNKIRIRGERNLDIVTSDWHPFFILEKFVPNPICPICEEKIKNIKAFAAHLRWHPKCREGYSYYSKYKVVEKRADELKAEDYILQNSDNLYPSGTSMLNNDLMWILGFFIGDGCISRYVDNRGSNNLKRHKIRFSSEHGEALRKVARILNQYFDCHVKVIKNEKRGKVLKEVSTSKKRVLDFFFQYGFQAGKKAYSVSISKVIKKNITRENVFSLLSGLIDSDSAINKRDGDIEYSTVSPQLAEDILEICTLTGIMISKSEKKVKRENEANLWRLRIPCCEATKINDKLNVKIDFSEIKEKLSDRKKRHFSVVRVKKVSKVSVRDSQFYDLTTKKNHNYLAGKNCLVFVHNTVFHIFLGERVQDSQQAKRLIRKVFENFKLPYLSLTPTFSICPHHGYLPGEHFKCPRCTFDQQCEVYSRVVGFLRPVGQWNDGKQMEFKQRKEFKISKS